MPKERKEEEKRKILQEARDRFRRGESWEANFRGNFKNDVKFSEGDAYNMWQWPSDVQNQRGKRPMLTVNRVRQHNLDILNDARQSRIAVKVRPVRGGATYEAAQAMDGIIRHIEYISNADSAYQLALKFAVQGGIGYWRLATDYAGDDTFDQEIFIRPIQDPLTVMLDCDISQFDGSDAKWGFIFSDMPREEFEKAYPHLKDSAADSELSVEVSWGKGERVRIAEYFRCVQDTTKLYGFVDPETGEQTIKTEKEIDAELLKQVIDDPETAIRQVVLTKVEHFKIVGDHLEDEKEWPGRYIPIIRVVGEETIIDNQLDRKGHTRALLDSQRMFNYNISASVEYGALQSKIPYVGPAMATEGFEEYWNTANIDNHSYLPFKHVDDEGNPIPAPQRQPPPQGAPVFMQGARDAVEQMYLASGQNQADFGQPGNERSGVAIQQRQRQGDNATYHYLDHQGTAIRFTGKQLIDLIGRVYDTARIAKFRDEAGTVTDLKIDPEAQEPYVQEEQEDGQLLAVLNPRIGSYDVEADVGPAYATRRQEAFAAFSQLLQSNKELINVVGDIWMRFADIPGGEEAAKRLKRMVPQQALHDGPPPDVAALQQQIQAMGQMLDQVSQKLADKTAAHLNDQEKNAVDAYEAQTHRLAAIKDYLATQPEMVMQFVAEVIREAEATSGAGLGPALQPNAELTAEDAMPPEQPPAPEGGPPLLG